MIDVSAQLIAKFVIPRRERVRRRFGSRDFRLLSLAATSGVRCSDTKSRSTCHKERSMADSSSAKSVAEQIVDVQRAIAGPHPGFRTVHAKGIVCTGTFAAGPEAKRISKAAHLQGQSVPVTLRFSNGSGDPNAPDGAPDARGLAVKFLLADGRKTDLLAITNEAFLVRTAEDFLAFL